MQSIEKIYLLEEKAVAALPRPVPTPGPTPPEDWEREDLNAPLPLWNLWGDAGLVTRLHIYALYHKKTIND